MLFDILINLLSDVIFIILILFIFWIVWYWPALRKAIKFFGVKYQREMNIFISVHKDDETTTRNVITVEEYEVADYLRRSINRQLKDSVFGRIADFLSGLIGKDPKIPEINILTERLDSGSVSGGAFVIGGPVRNKVYRMVVDEGNPWITYNRGEEKFQIEKGERRGEFIEHSGRLSIIEKIKINDAVFILVYGFGEEHTRRATEYLANNWKILYKIYNEDEFALCFVIDLNGTVQIVEEFRGE